MRLFRPGHDNGPSTKTGHRALTTTAPRSWATYVGSGKSVSIGGYPTAPYQYATVCVGRAVRGSFFVPSSRTRGGTARTRSNRKDLT